MTKSEQQEWSFYDHGRYSRVASDKNAVEVYYRGHLRIARRILKLLNGELGIVDEDEIRDAVDGANRRYTPDEAFEQVMRAVGTNDD